MRANKWFCWASFIVAAAISACSAGSGESTNKSYDELTVPLRMVGGDPLTLLATVGTKTGSTVEFYEAVDGRIGISETGGADVTPVGDIDTHTMTASEIYGRVAPGRPVPDAIVQAEAHLAAAERADTTRHPTPRPAFGSKPGDGPVADPNGGALTTLSASPPPGNPSTFCSGAWFYNNVKYAKVACDGGTSSDGITYFKTTWCWYDRGPGAWADGSGLSFDAAAICTRSTSNDIILKVYRDSNYGTHSWSVPSYSWRWYDFLAASNFWGFERYMAQAEVDGSWGDIQYAGGFDW
jgi:hypothetical protein